MKTNLIITLAASALSLAACSHNPTREQIGTVGGAALGGAAGNVLFDGSAVGTVGGAAAGALIGKEVGEDMDRKRGRR